VLSGGIPLPLTPGTIIAAKFAVVLVSEWATLVPITLPFLLVVEIQGGHGLGYWLRAGLAYVFAPVVPLAAAAVVAMLIARVTNLSRRREFFRVVAGQGLLTGWGMLAAFGGASL